MTATQPAVLPVHHTLSKPQMEDRKRSLAADADDLAPSRKRIIKDENGQQMRLDADKEKDVENYQKDALLRQMKEYKREKKHYEDLCHDLNRKLTNHDDHLRAVDAWFAQLLDELRVLAGESLPTPPSDITTGGDVFKSALLAETFVKQLHSHGASVKSAIADIFQRIPTTTPQLQSLQEQIVAALAKEKATLVDCQRLTAEKEQLTERLESASYRYMKAERQLDRAKSAQVQKLERQAYANPSGDLSSPVMPSKAATPVRREHSETNGDDSGSASVEAETARAEALAVAESRKKQLAEVEAENTRLTNELSAARTKVASLNDDDYAATTVFKSMKSQYENVIKRINDLEAVNIQLREDAQKLHNERTSYRLQVEEEVRSQVAETEANIARCEVDLARIRNSRDEMIAEINVRKSAEDNRRSAADMAKELAQARDQKIVSLEAELERLKLQLGNAPKTTSAEHLDNMTIDDLKSKLFNLEQQHMLLGQELPSIEDAWSKAQALASRKLIDADEAEERLSRLSAEKTKAEQKYFATMKAKDAKEQELRLLKMKDARSSEIVSQLKDADVKTKEYIVALERQLIEAKEVVTNSDLQYRACEQKQNEAQISLTGMNKQVDEFKSLIGGKDEELIALKKARHDVEDALESCKARLEESQKQMEAMRKSRVASNGADSDMWRKLAICPVCNTNIRNTAMKQCGHVFCGECVNVLVTNRSRKCPSCGKAFGINDSMPVVLA